MSLALYSREHVLSLLRGKTLWFCGDSNVRALYKDLVWLVENNTLAADWALKMKNEKSFEGDARLSNGECTNSTGYEEEREYDRHIRARFVFLTRINKKCLYKALGNCQRFPDVMIFNSCLWDISRWGPKSIEDYKKNVPAVMAYLKSTLPRTTRVIFTTTCPVSSKGKGGFLSEDMKFMRSVLPWHIAEANAFLAKHAKDHEFDVVDLYYHTKLMLDIRAKDGIHWEPLCVRFKTNVLLTHIALCEDVPLPYDAEISLEFLRRSHLYPAKAEAHTNQKNRRKIARAKRRISAACDDKIFFLPNEPINQLNGLMQQ